jgi:hypothetical protein
MARYSLKPANPSAYPSLACISIVCVGVELCVHMPLRASFRKDEMLWISLTAPAYMGGPLSKFSEKNLLSSWQAFKRNFSNQQRSSQHVLAPLLAPSACPRGYPRLDYVVIGNC